MRIIIRISLKQFIREFLFVTNKHNALWSTGLRKRVKFFVKLIALWFLLWEFFFS